jgi:hypothetical protein
LALGGLVLALILATAVAWRLRRPKPG